LNRPGVGESSRDVFGCQARKKEPQVRVSATLLTVNKAHVDAYRCFRHFIECATRLKSASWSIKPDGAGCCGNLSRLLSEAAVAVPVIGCHLRINEESNFRDVSSRCHRQGRARRHWRSFRHETAGGICLKIRPMLMASVNAG
jgi:hypothetical protein